MRARLVTSTVATLFLGVLLLPGTARASPAPAVPVVDVRAHDSTAGTALVSGYDEPGAGLRVAAGRTSAARRLKIGYQVQETGCWCGPAGPDEPPLLHRLRLRHGDRTVLIADPASFGGNQIYWISFDRLAALVPPKGYSA